MKTKKDILFSIIVPVYNTEKYIEKCLDSIYKAIDIDCEVIIINDGSKDNSGKVIKKYLAKLSEEQKKNTTYVKKENRGLADTKNVGISLAQGEYISVVDSDDTISDDFYTTARRYIPENDIIIYDLYLDFEENNKFNRTERAIREDADGDFINKIFHGAMLGSSCNKIIKKDLYTLDFPVGKEYEDVAVTPFILLNTKKIKYIPNPNYIYLQRGKSIVSSNTLDSAFYKICENINSVLSNIKEKISKYEEIINVFYIDRTIDMLDLSLKNSKRKFVNRLEEFYSKNNLVIKYIVENKLIDSKTVFLTDRQYKILNKIYSYLYNKEFKKIKNLLFLRRIVNWSRGIMGLLKELLKKILGGIYG